MPVLKLLQFVTKESTKKLSKKVAQDLNHVPVKVKWTHSDKIKELHLDELLSPDYIKKLINSSRKPTDLKEIIVYLKDEAKTTNLNDSVYFSLLKSAKSKLKKLEDSELMKELLKQAKNGTLHFIDFLN